MAKRIAPRTRTVKTRRVVAQTTVVVTGLDIHLSNDEATHLSYFMHNAHDGRYPRVHGQKFLDNWPWAKAFVEELDAARGDGCTMGRRVRKEVAK